MRTTPNPTPRPVSGRGAHSLPAALALVATAALTLGACSTAQDAPGSARDDSSATSLPTPTTSLPSGASGSEGSTSQDPAVAAVLEALTGPDGEYAALAQYDAVLDRYGDVEPFATIAQAEQRHAEALERQLQRLGVDVPADSWAGTLTAPDDLTQAARAWADGEVANVALYDDLLAQVADDPALTRVFANLRAASERSHLPLFRAAADNGGTLTTAQMTELAPAHGDGHGGGPGGGHGGGGGAGGWGEG